MIRVATLAFNDWKLVLARIGRILGPLINDWGGKFGVCKDCGKLCHSDWLSKSMEPFLEATQDLIDFQTFLEATVSSFYIFSQLPFNGLGSGFDLIFLKKKILGFIYRFFIRKLHWKSNSLPNIFPTSKKKNHLLLKHPTSKILLEHLLLKCLISKIILEHLLLKCPTSKKHWNTYYLNVQLAKIIGTPIT